MSTITVTTYEAKAQLSKLLAACERGDTVTITRGAKPVATLTAIRPSAERDHGFLDLHLSAQSVSELVNPLDDKVLPGWYQE